MECYANRDVKNATYKMLVEKMKGKIENVNCNMVKRKINNMAVHILVSFH